MARWISKLVAFLKSWLYRSAGGSDETAEEVDLRDRVKVVSIFVNEKRKIEKTEPARARVDNFRPRLNPASGRQEKSSLCLEELGETECWIRLQAGSIREVLGRADLQVRDITEQALALDPDWNPERHVNIVDWPEAEGLITEAAQALYRAHAFAPRKQA